VQAFEQGAGSGPSVPGNRMFYDVVVGACSSKPLILTGGALEHLIDRLAHDRELIYARIILSLAPTHNLAWGRARTEPLTKAAARVGPNSVARGTERLPLSRPRKLPTACYPRSRTTAEQAARNAAPASSSRIISYLAAHRFPTSGGCQPDPSRSNQAAMSLS